MNCCSCWLVSTVLASIGFCLNFPKCRLYYYLAYIHWHLWGTFFQPTLPCLEIGLIWIFLKFCGNFCLEISNRPNMEVSKTPLLGSRKLKTRRLALDESGAQAVILHFAQQLDDKIVQTFENFMGLSVGPLDRQHFGKMDTWPRLTNQTWPHG